MIRATNPSLSLVLSLVLSLAFGGHARAGNVVVPTDAPTITDGLALAGPGGTVTVQEGIYHEHLDVLYSGQTLRGRGTVTLDAARYSGIYVPQGVNDVTIKHIQIRNCRYGVVAIGENVRVLGCQVLDPTLTGIQFTDTRNCSVKRTRISGAGTYGVGLAFADNCVVQNCVIERSAHDGINVIGNDNSILSNRVSDASGFGIMIGDSEHATIGTLVECNRVERTFADGINCEPSSSYTTVQRNTVKDADGDGIDVEYPSRSQTLVRNKVYDSASDGIVVGGDDCVVQRNKSVRSSGHGLQVEFLANYGQFDRNKIKLSGHDGLRVDGTDNTISRNRSSSNTGYDRYSNVALWQNTWIDNHFDTSNL